MTDLETGQRVEWTVGNIKSKGVVLECKGEFTDVVTHFIGGTPSVQEIEVSTEILIKVN